MDTVDVARHILSGQWYNSHCIVQTIVASGLLTEDVMVVDPHAVADRVRRATMAPPRVAICPVHRGGNHWVLYILKRQAPSGPYACHFGDSLEGQASDAELRRLLDIIRKMTGEAAAVEQEVSSLGIPRQKDWLSCGPFVTQAALNFLRQRWTPVEHIKQRHMAMVDRSSL